MVTQTMSPEAILQPRILEGIINKKLEQQLDFIGMFPEIRTDAVGFSYMEDLTTAGADISAGTMGAPLELGELSELSEIEVSTISMKHGSLARFGYQLRFSQRQLREVAFIDEVGRAVDRAVFGLSKKMNDDIIDSIKANGQSLGNGAAAWGDPSATPVEDILSFVEASMVEGYPYELSDLYLHKTNFFEMMKYIQGIDIAWVQDPFGPRQLPVVNGVTLHNMHSTQVSEGSYLGADARFPGITVYQYLDPKHSTMEGGRINVNKYEETRYPYEIVVELYAERGIAPKLPYALYYDADGI